MWRCSSGAWHSSRLNRTDIVYFLILQAPLSIPVIWAELMSAHSVEHSGFAYRSFLVLSIFPLLAALLLLMKGPEASDRSSPDWGGPDLGKFPDRRASADTSGIPPETSPANEG